jgi:growth arrest-specific protein 8
MPPKRNPRNKKPEEGEVAETADQQEWKQLKGEADRLHKLAKKEEHDFNEFQQQREKLNYFWIVEKKKLEDKRVELRNKDRELQDLEEKHQVEIKIYKRRLKHLLFEHQNELTRKKTEAEEALKMAQDDDRETENDLKEDRRLLNSNLKETEFSHEEYLRSMKREQDAKVTFLRHEFERKANEVQKMFDARIKQTRELLDKKRKEEIRAIEEKKTAMIAILMEEHKKTFADIKNYYSDITHNNLDFIKNLKENLKVAEQDEKKDLAKLHEKKIANQEIAAPLKKMQDDVERLKLQKQEYDHEKEQMTKIKTQLLIVESQQSNLQWEYETLFQRLDALKLEKQTLELQLKSSIYEVKQKTAFRGMLLEKKLTALNKVQEEREAQLNEVLSRANLEPTVLSQVKGHVDDILMRKNNDARLLQGEYMRLVALHDSLYANVQKKLEEYGLSMVELGFEPVKADKQVVESITNTMKLTNTI